MTKRPIGAQLILGFGAMILLICGVGLLSVINMWRSTSLVTTTSNQYLPLMQLATAFEREILNARIHFIYRVTVQKPGALEAGRSRFRKVREPMPKLLSHVEASPRGQRPAATAEEIAAAAPELSTQAESMKSVTRHLAALVE